MFEHEHSPDGFSVRTSQFVAGFLLGISLFFLLLGSYHMPAVAYAEVVRAQLAEEEIVYLDALRKLISERKAELEAREALFEDRMQELYSTLSTRTAVGYATASTTG